MIRLLARGDLRNNNHIKTIKCEGVRKIRSLNESLELFSSGNNEHDGILVIDTVASLYERQNCLLSSSVDHTYVPLPLTIGGGITGVDKALSTLQRGADKILINTHAVQNPFLLEAIASKVGIQSVVLQIDVRFYEGEYRCFTHGARELSSVSFVDWLSNAKNYGVGEVHITSIDTEGTNQEFPPTLAELCCSLTDLPLIVSGGFRSASQIAKIYSSFGIKAFSLSSYTNILGYPISDLRVQLASLGVPVRKP